MKKILLTVLLSCMSFLWFTSAVNVSCIEDWTCDPSNIYNFSDNDNSYIFNISCSADLFLEDDTEYNLTDWQIITLPGWTTAEFVWVEDCDFSYELYENNNSADTVWNFTSDSTIFSLTLSDSSSVSVENLLSINQDIFGSDFYVCISTNDIPYYFNYDWALENPISSVSSSNYCSSDSFSVWDYEFYFTSDLEYTSKNLNWTFYFSSSPITYSSSSDWDSSDSSWLLPWWTWTFWWIISSLGSAVSEFIPYVAYIWLWLLGAIIWFVAIKRLINRVRAKIFWTFSWWRRR